MGTEDDDTDARDALQEVRDDLDGLRTRLKQVPHPAGGGAQAPGDHVPSPRPGDPGATPDRRQG